jgi:putative Mg2+ transporter-C (MgtC) family protein
MFQEIWATIVSEFSDVLMAAMTFIAVRLGIAAILGEYWVERERKARSAGIRTHMLPWEPAPLFVHWSTSDRDEIEDLSGFFKASCKALVFYSVPAQL